MAEKRSPILSRVMEEVNRAAETAKQNTLQGIKARNKKQAKIKSLFVDFEAGKNGYQGFTKDRLELMLHDSKEIREEIARNERRIRAQLQKRSHVPVH